MRWVRSFVDWVRRLLAAAREDDANRAYFRSVAAHWQTKPEPDWDEEVAAWRKRSSL